MRRYALSNRLIDDGAETRRHLMSAYDALPALVRAALRECAFDVHVLIRVNRYMDCSQLIERISSLRTEQEAIEFNRQYAVWR